MCELLSGYNKVCDITGGVETWYAFATKDTNGESNIDTLTFSNGAVTALTLKSGKYAYPFVVEQETSFINDTAIGERANGAYAREQAGEIRLHGNTASMIVMIEAMAKGRTTWIAKLNDGTFEIFFLENGAKVSDARQSGTAYEDMNGNVLTLTGKERYKAMKIDSAIVLALLEPAS